MHSGAGLAGAAGGVGGALRATGVGQCMLFEPAEAEGLGIRPSAVLLQAGVVAAEHLSARATVWLEKYAEARVRHPMLPDTRAGKEEWKRVLREVVAAGLEALAAASTATRHGELRGQLSLAGSGARAAKSARHEAASAEAVVFDEAAQRRI